LNADTPPPSEEPDAKAIPVPGDGVGTKAGIERETQQSEALKEFERLSLVIQRRTFLATVVLTLVTAAYASFAYLQWTATQDTNVLASRSAQNAELATRLTKRSVSDARESETESSRNTREQLRLTEESLSLTRKQLEANDRPWVGVSVEMAGPLTFSTDGVAMMSFRYLITNSGRSVATSVQIKARLISQELSREHFFHALEEQVRLCDRNDKEGSAIKPEVGPLGHTIFPGAVDGGYMSTSMGKKEMEKAAILFKDTTDTYVAPALIGCVIYRFPNATKDHKTRFAYSILRKDADKDPVHPLSIQVGKNLPVDRLVLERYFFGGGYAD
jgi:hypothetical protein